MIKIVHINMFPILDSYRVKGIFNSHTRPHVNHAVRNQLAGDVLNLVAYRLWKLQLATRTVHNRAAACVAAGGGIFENQL